MQVYTETIRHAAAGRLRVEERDVAELARAFGTPL